MAYIILKKSQNMKHHIIVNDSEGIPIEWDNYDDAKYFADLFQANTTHNSIYEVKKIG